MESFVFAGNRRRWKYVRPVVGVAGMVTGLWFAALCWVLLKAPELPELDLALGTARPTVLAEAGTTSAHGLRHGLR